MVVVRLALFPAHAGMNRRRRTAGWRPRPVRAHAGVTCAITALECQHLASCRQPDRFLHDEGKLLTTDGDGATGSANDNLHHLSRLMGGAMVGGSCQESEVVRLLLPSEIAVDPPRHRRRPDAAILRRHDQVVRGARMKRDDTRGEAPKLRSCGTRGEPRLLCEMIQCKSRHTPCFAGPR